MKTTIAVISAVSFVLGAIAMAVVSQPSDAKPVMLVDFGTQQCISVDGDPHKCKITNKADAIIKNNAF